jgi:hypothetical protein
MIHFEAAPAALRRPAIAARALGWNGNLVGERR